MLGMDKHSTIELHPQTLGIYLFILKRLLSPLTVSYFRWGPPWSISLFLAIACPDVKGLQLPTPASASGLLGSQACGITSAFRLNS